MTADIRYRAQSIDLERVGIETVYGGVTFRSRLEARWAAFFDRIEWLWEYEPIDLSGYVPDFIIRLPRAPLLVEVKPAFTDEDLRPAAKKTCLSGWRGDFMLVGGSLLGEDDGWMGLALGLLAYWDEGPDGEWGYLDMAPAHRCKQCRRISAHHDSGHWRCLVCGAYEGKNYLLPLEAGELRAIWVEAGNAVQWKPRGRR